MSGLSIRWRLTLWYGVVLGAVLAAFGGSVYLMMRHELVARLDADLEGELQEVVDDIESAHAFLEERGVTSTGPQHFVDGQMTPGVEPNRADYGTFIYFDDPDGNSWAVQEVRHHAR